MKEKIITKDELVNQIAVYFILEYGVQRLKNEKDYNTLMSKIDKFSNKKSHIITPEKQKEGLKLSRQISELSHEEIKQFIKEISLNTKKRNVER